MSFWDNNKDTFKKAGIATAKGIGHGTKSLSKAGYATYKKHDAQRKGLPPPQTESASNPESTSSPPPALPTGPALTREQIISLPAPPKRTVPTLEPGSGERKAVAYVPTPTQVQPPTQPPTVPARAVPAPPQGYTRAQMADPGAPLPAPVASLPQQQASPSAPVAQAPVAVAPAETAPVAAAAPIAQLATPPARVATQPAAVAEAASTPQQATDAKPRVPKPAPDAALFAPPPVRKDRTAPQTAPAKTKPPTLPTRASASAVATTPASPPPPYSAGGGASPPATAAPTPTASPAAATLPSPLHVDVSTIPPPPRRVGHPPVSRTDTGSAPPPPPRAASVASSGVSSRVVTPVATGTKKVPPPKPAKLQAVSRTGGSLQEPEAVEAQPPLSQPKPVSAAHNFAAEIAKLKVSGSSSPAKPHRPSTTGQAPSKPSDSATVEPQLAGLSKPTKPGKPAKPVKTGNQAEPTSPAKPEKPAKPVKPAKPAKPVGVSPSPVSTPSPNIMQNIQPIAVSPKAPPRAPPSRNGARAEHTPTPPPPPPARNYKRPAVSLPKTGPPALDLELSTGWFANISGPLTLPRCFAGLNYSSSFSSSMKVTPAGQQSDHCRTMEVRFKDLSKAVYAIKWKNSDYATAVAEVERYVPSPIDHKAPTKQQLGEYNRRFGTYISSWCQHKEGQKVGTGECWDLARDALAKGCGKHAFVSQYLHHGYPFLVVEGANSGVQVTRGPEDEIREGDVLQFETARFHDKASGTTQTAGAPDHTSVVISKDGEKIHVLEQNVGGVKIVVKGVYVLSNLVSGKVTAYRPVPAEWAD